MKTAKTIIKQKQNENKMKTERKNEYGSIVIPSIDLIQHVYFYRLKISNCYYIFISVYALFSINAIKKCRVLTLILITDARTLVGLLGLFV